MSKSGLRLTVCELIGLHDLVGSLNRRVIIHVDIASLDDRVYRIGTLNVRWLDWQVVEAQLRQLDCIEIVKEGEQ